jgi:hypothetical protein
MGDMVLTGFEGALSSSSPMGSSTGAGGSAASRCTLGTCWSALPIPPHVGSDPGTRPRVPGASRLEVWARGALTLFSVEPWLSWEREGQNRTMDVTIHSNQHHRNRACPGRCRSGLVRHGEGRAATVRIHSFHGNVIAFPNDAKAKDLQLLDHPCLRGIDRELRHQMAIPASATKASRTGGSGSRTSLPKVSMWNLMADFTSVRASS